MKLSAIESVITERGIKFQRETIHEFPNICVIYQLFGEDDLVGLMIHAHNIYVPPSGDVDPSTTYVDQVSIECKGSSSQEKDFSNDVVGIVKYLDEWLDKKSKS